jgi:hypothetical protein
MLQLADSLQGIHASLGDLAAGIVELKKVPAEWDSLSSYPTTITVAALESLSSKLVHHGFPSIPTMLLSGSLPASTSQRELVRTLFWSVQNLLHDYSTKSNAIHNLSQQV